MLVDEREMLETEFQKWHDKQVRREEVLKLVEDKVICTTDRDSL